MKKVWKRATSGVMAGTILVSQFLGVAGFDAYAKAVPGQPAFQAEINLENGGSIRLSSGAELTKPWNDVTGPVNGKTIGMIPGKTVIVNGDGDVQPSTVTAEETLENGISKGIRMAGDLTGVKSYFQFYDEIVCLGAGIGKGADAPEGEVAQVIDNIPIITGKTRAALTNPTNADKIITNMTSQAAPNGWKDVIDKPTQGKHARNYIFASQKTTTETTEGIEWSYFFPDTITNSNLWYKFNTYELGGENVQRFESWLKPKTDKTFAYTLGAEIPSASFKGVATYTGKSRILANTTSLQAACNTAEGILSVNKWDSTEQTLENPVVPITLIQPVSLTVHQNSESETTKLTVAKPEGDSAPYIEITVKEKGAKLLSVSNPAALAGQRYGDEAYLKLDTSRMTDPVVIELVKAPETKEYHTNKVYTIGVDLDQQEHTGTTVINPFPSVTNYFDDYWQGINLNRLPGTTLINSESVVISGDGNTPGGASTDSAWVGGNTSLNGGAVKGIELTGGDVTGKKSYMMFEDKIVCLGAGLNKRPGMEGSLVTTLDNTLVTDKKNSKINISYSNKTFDGLLTNWTLGEIYGYKNGPAIVNDNSWFFLQYRSDPGLGFYMPKDDLKNAQCRLRAAEGQNGTDKLYYEFWLNHGESENASYQYVILPGKTAAGDIKAYFDKPETAVLVNTAQIQAVYDTKSQTVAANFWDEFGGSVQDARISGIQVDKKASVMMTEKEGEISVSVSDPTKQNNGSIRLEISRKWYSVIELQQGVTADESNKDKIVLTFDVSRQDGGNLTARLNTMPAAAAEDQITLVRGNQTRLEAPSDFVAPVTWTSCYLKPDGTTVNMTGYSKYKRPLEPGESEGQRTYGPASASHMVSAEVLSGGLSSLITGKQKGTASVVAKDSTGKEKVWTVTVLYEDPQNLPAVTPEDFAKIRTAWRESIVGKNLTETEAGQAALDNIDAAAKKAWDSYAFKGQDSCTDIPWPGDTDENGGGGNPDIPFRDDALEFRSVVRNLLAMAKAYAAEGSEYYKNQDMLNDMRHVLDWFSMECYSPKSQTDNWWNWEIGLPKDLVPLLILISEDLSKEELELYCSGMRFFQPDPFYEGAINFASTHAQGLRNNEGANLIDCSVAAMGMGAVLEDNEDVYLASLATSGQFIINQVADSTNIVANGYSSGFYQDGSYLDHSYIPYTGSYGIEFFRGGANIASMLSGTPWEYKEETIENLGHYVLEGFNTSIYRGHMLDALKGRSVSRPKGDGRSAGRDTMGLILRMLAADAFTPETAQVIKSNVKNWLEADPGYIDSLKDASVLTIRALAEDILNDSTIDSQIPPLHKNMPFMDRGIHRTDNYLFALSMYSSRIQNCEVTNGENLYGWHQGDGATYLYNDDLEHYVDNYWNTVNPYRLAGTTVVPVNIGNGVKDSSNYYQEGDYRSKENWVGGSQIGNYGINGMALSGDITSQKVEYAPNLRAKKSYFMFEDEIVCLGAGITNSGQQLPVETTIENRKLNDTASNQVLIDGGELDLTLVQNQVAGIVEGTENTEGTMVSDPTWAYLEGNTETSGVGYYFPKKDQNIYLRKTENTGDWSNIGTSSGQGTKSYLEMWFDHGVNPDQETYEYAILPGKTPQEMETYAEKPGFTVLANNGKVQAVYSEDTGITGINFWEGGMETVAQVKANKAASVMLEETEDGILTIAVSDPTMKNTRTIELEINRPVLSILEQDENVDAELTESGTLKLTVQTKGTNGNSSYAKVQLLASVYPSAVTMQKGEKTEFTVREFGHSADAYTWKVTGNQTYRAAKTEITDLGSLTVDAKETNGSLTVSAVSQSGMELPVLVNLRGDLAVQLPEEVKQVNQKMDNLLSMVGEKDLTEPQVMEAVKDAIDSMAKTPNQTLKEYSLDKVLKLEEIFIQAMEANGRSVSVHAEEDESVKEIFQQVQVKGLALNIGYGGKATASNAVAVINAADSPGKAKTDSKPWKSSPSNAASPSNASRSAILSEILESGKKVYLNANFYLEDEEGNRALIDNLKAPVVLVLGLPESLEENQEIHAYYMGTNGLENTEISVSVNENNRTMQLVLTGSGVVALEYTEKAAAEEPEDPGNPETPENPNQPNPPAPSKPSGNSGRFGPRPTLNRTAGSWTRDENGWFFLKKDGLRMQNQWIRWNSRWYYLGEDSYMVTGWLQESGQWYWLKDDGSMAENEWIFDQENQYYMGKNGHFAVH